MKYYVIAGEASGDLHGANLIKELKAVDPQASIRCWGGDLMQAAGGHLVKHYKELAFMGFLEVFTNIATIFKNISFCKEDIHEFQPDVLIFIDYSGFNLRIAKWAKKEGFKTSYYIAPQIWASREGRIEKIKSTIDNMYVTLPFEKEFYEKKHQYKVHFVGHPLIDAVENYPKIDSLSFKKEYDLSLNKPIIALLPGSRKQEVSKMLLVMLSVAQDFPDYQFVIAGAPSLDEEFYTPFLKNTNIGLIFNKTYEILQVAHAALVTSGTATLETALFKVPQVVCYKGSWISYQIAKRIITLKYISLVNLIMDRELVKELIQENLTTHNLKTELSHILDPSKRKTLLENYDLLEEKLGGSGASKNTAQLIYQQLKA
ncbi:lipid-A-disaccharide synthase [Cellulophaga sp. Hel_I_12]|uniref:lipid-A-disaccharide synthase n=1 Tax=Cellulophaga sp. Hel_I_12 TaxID=1249972 RepID=UPI000646F168|nr:lipid-A-disaccharide synthase [Cellulophaga sp. Hel_I_12]